MFRVVLRKTNYLGFRRKLGVSFSLFRGVSWAWKTGTGRWRRPLSAHADQGRKPKHVSAGDGDAVLRRLGRSNCAVRTGSGKAAGGNVGDRHDRSDASSGGRGSVRAQPQSAGALALTPARRRRPPPDGVWRGPTPQRSRSPPPVCRAAATGTRGRVSGPPLRSNGLLWHPFPTVGRSGKICNPPPNTFLIRSASFAGMAPTGVHHEVD